MVFQPLAMPSLIFLFLLYGMEESNVATGGNRDQVISVVVVNTLVLPLFMILILRITNVLSSVKMEDKKDRLLPFAIVSILYFITTYLFYIKLWLDFTLVFALFVMTFCLILLTSITVFWKISAHMTGVAGLLAIVLVMSIKYPLVGLLYPLISVTLLTGAIASARLYLNAHSPLEIVGGFLLGFTVCFSSFYYLLFT
jgi:membrane-associated phospholipid phosphatase